MNICVVGTKATKESSIKLAEVLGCPWHNAFDENNYQNYSLVFNYGSARQNRYTNIINNPVSCRTAINKFLTLSTLAAESLPVVNFCKLKESVPNKWKSIVVRTAVDGKENAGMSYIDKGESIPDAEMYTEFFEHKFEFRIVTFLGKVIARYIKKRYGKEWHFEDVDATGFDAIDACCVKANKVLGLDYVGYDVLANSQRDFVILEANSGPILTDDVAKQIKEKLCK